MKSIIYIFFSCLFLLKTNIVEAQILQMTDPEKLSSDITHFDILGKVNGNIILYKYGRNYNEINAFDAQDLDLSWSKEIRFKSKRPNMLEMILTDNGALAFYSVRQNGMNNLLVQPIDKQFRLKGEPILINETNNKGVIYRVNHSANRKYFAIEMIDRQGANNQNIEVVLFSLGLQKINSVELINENNWKFKQTKIGLNGELFLLSDKSLTGFFSDSEVLKGIKINKLIDGVLTEQMFKQRDTMIVHYESELDLKNEQLIIAGTYKGDNIADGYFYTTLDYNNNESILNSTIFTDLPEILKTQTSRKLLLGPKDRLGEIKFRKVIPRTDGGALILGEIYNKSVINNNGGNINTDLFAGRNIQTKSYSYDDMVVFSIEPNGNLEWSEVLRKSQYSEDDDGHFSSFGVMNLKNKVHLIFNEQIDYITPVSSFGLSNKGTTGIKTLFNSEKYDILMSPRHAKQVAKNEMVIPAYTTRNYFVLVQLIY